MSAMLGSPRRTARPRLRLEGGELVLVERRAFRTWTTRLLVRFETLFASRSRP